MAHSAAEAADHNQIKESNEDAAKSGEEPPDAFSDLSPDELDAFAEHRRLQAALAEASAYGGGENASGRQARRHKDSSRPSHILPEAWWSMSAFLRKSCEAEVAAKRNRLRQQLTDLAAKYPSLDCLRN